MRPHGRKVLVSTQDAVQKLCAARLAADVMACDGAARAHGCGSATLVTSDIDENDKPFLTGSAQAKGSTGEKRIDQAISRDSRTRRTPI